MANRYFELTENIAYDEAPELHNQFMHYLRHELKATFITETKDKHVVVADNQARTISELFGGPEDKYLNLYHIFEFSKF